MSLSLSRFVLIMDGSYPSSLYTVNLLVAGPYLIPTEKLKLHICLACMHMSPSKGSGIRIFLKVSNPRTFLQEAFLIVRTKPPEKFIYGGSHWKVPGKKGVAPSSLLPFPSPCKKRLQNRICISDRCHFTHKTF